jgi:hypothetical protein
MRSLGARSAAYVYLVAEFDDALRRQPRGTIVRLCGRRDAVATGTSGWESARRVAFLRPVVGKHESSLTRAVGLISVQLPHSPL